MAAAVRFVIGRAGTGKSRMVNHEIEGLCRAGKAPVLIVSEQFTFEAERALSQRLGGLMGVEVFSFTSLAERILPREVTRFLSRQGRRMVIRRVVEERRERLTAFKRVSALPGFSAKCEELFSLCKRCEIAPAALLGAAKALDGEEDAPLQAKLLDIGLLYEGLEGALMGRLTQEDALAELRARLDTSFLAGRDVFVDGCDIWAEQIFGVLEGLMDCAASLTYTLRGDVSPDCRDRELFSPEMLSYARLRDAAQARGCRIERVYLPQEDAPWGESRYESPALAHLERELFAINPRVFPGPPGGLRVFAAADRSAEAEAVADGIQALAMEGLRYRDMAVVTADLSGYGDLMQRVFRRRGIPYFTDAKHPLADYALPRLLLYALRAVSRGLGREDVLSLAKTGLAGQSREETEHFENYALRYGIRGTGFTKPFERGGDPSPAETARAKLMAPLLKLREELAAGADARSKTRALYGYMEALGVGEATERDCQDLKASGRLVDMEGNMQIYEIVMQLFSQLYAIMGESPMSTARFLAIFEEGLSAYEVGAIPSTADQVLLGSLDRTKARPLRAMFLMGALEGSIPEAPDRDRVIDDSELARLSALGVPAWNSADMNMAVYRLDAYNALSKPSAHLMLSYPACGDEGARSSLVDTVVRLFPALEVESSLTPREAMDPPGGFSALAAALRNYVDTGEEPPGDLYAWYAGSPEYRDRLALVEEALYHDASPAPFGRELAEAVYGLGGSASRLETFNSCPFKHFSRYGLRLEPRREYRERPMDEGGFCHEALSLYTELLLLRKPDLSSLTEAEIFAMLGEIFPDLMSSHNGGVLLSTARNRAIADRLIRRVQATALALTRQLAAGGFKPLGSELEFGPGRPWPALQLCLPDGRSYILSGKIDRLDAFSGPDGVRRYRVVDYKNGGEDFDFGELYHGLKLQLPLYLSALLSADKAAKSAGMYYFPIQDPAVEAEGQAELERALQKEFLLSGLTLSEPEVLRATNEAFIPPKKGRVDAGAMERILGYARDKAGRSAYAMLEGHAEVSPCRRGKALSCKYCDYRSLCGFDSRRPTGRVRNADSMKLEDFLERTEHEMDQ